MTREELVQENEDLFSTLEEISDILGEEGDNDKKSLQDRLDRISDLVVEWIGEDESEGEEEE